MDQVSALIEFVVYLGENENSHFDKRATHAMTMIKERFHAVYIMS